MKQINPSALPQTVTGPAVGAYAVTPSNTVDLAAPIRALTLNVGGVVVYDWAGQTWTTGPLPAGTYPLWATRIRATGTTATGLTGWV